MRFFQRKKTAGQYIRRLAAQCAAIAFLGLSCQAQAEPENAENHSLLRRSIFKLLERKPPTVSISSIRNVQERLHFTLINLYLENGIAPHWVTEDGPRQKAYALLSVLQKADEEGMSPAWYRTGEIEQLLSSRELEQLARLDVLLSQALCAYVRDMREGRTAACLAEPALLPAAYSRDEETSRLIREGLNAPDLTRFLELLAPQHTAYQTLKKLLAAQRRLAAAGSWPKIPEGKKLEPGMADDRLDFLAQRLLASGDLLILPSPVFAEPPTLPGEPYLPEAKPHLRIYDDTLVKAVKQFQSRSGLEPDGIVGKMTLAALNITPQEQLEQIIANLERWRWLPHELSGRRIVVNIADFTLTSLNDEQAEIKMPVIVGEVDNKTPVFSHAMSYIEMNPYWTVPPSIARKEIVEKMRKDPGYLQKERIRIFAGWDENAPEVHPDGIDWHSIGGGITRYRLRQDPGPANALGTIKFVFPNTNHVYLHDTPGQSLFRQARRSFSHGCIRVSQPLELALHILGQDGQNVSKETITKQIASGKQRVFILKRPLPVHIIYRTAWVDPVDGTAHFYDDIYGHDALLAKTLPGCIPPEL
jgi:murein L,D-transpeptidase YcbB/YkuD